MALIYNEEMKQYNHDNRQVIRVKINSKYKWDFYGYNRNDFSVWINQEITPINYSKWTKFRTEDFLSELQKKVKVYLVTIRKCQMEMDFKCSD